MKKIFSFLIIVALASSMSACTEQKQTTFSKAIGKQKKSSHYQPKPGISWQWQLQEKINTSYDVDLYDIDLFEAQPEIINKLHTRGTKIICYLSAGTWEKFRPDAKKFPTKIIGKTLADWKNERWLDISNYPLFAQIILKRLDLAKQKNCDGIEPDNIHAYQEDSGFSLNYENQLQYNKWLAIEAHKRNLSIALKNDLEQIPDLIDFFDFTINEQCFYYNECEKLLPFIESGKAVLGVEYELETTKFCTQAKLLNFSWLKMDYDLDGARISCQ